MEMRNNYLLVEIDQNHNRIVKHGALELLRPEEWVVEETVDNGRVYDVNRDLRQVNPQIARVIAGNPKCKAQPGQKIFIHFLAADNGQPIDYNGKEYKAIFLHQVFFIIHGEGQYEMMDDLYLGEQVYSDGIKTESGIYLTSQDKKKEVLQVRITHAPANSRYAQVGDTVISIDDYQYVVEIDGKTYIKLAEHEIAGKIIENEVILKTA